MRWETYLRRWFQLYLPDNYLAWDTETTGFNKSYDVPLEFGWAMVRGGNLSSRGSFILDWTRYPQYVEEAWLREQITRLEHAFREQGRQWHIPFQRLASDGQDPFFVMRFMRDLFTANREADAWFVGHNLLAYDQILTENLFAEWLGESWQWRDTETIDTGVLEKIARSQELEPRLRLTPEPNEPFWVFQQRAARASRRIKWNADVCVARYGLLEKNGLEKKDLHGAGTDAFVSSLLIEHHKEP